MDKNFTGMQYQQPSSHQPFAESNRSEFEPSARPCVLETGIRFLTSKFMGQAF
ncbi:hypothetical protein M413DRAFT_441751 [Hebeloma cylindrosporum]|uniref:Uncharacterized protein n=1 Tax=Hebeloma cylindrosporum TaxID=76867 RepID=A0A0C2Y5K0_HEBCY|nr:hypothetical protein M413DRAFT_441751 [Hebeloma cylindrosporum h7]